MYTSSEHSLEDVLFDSNIAKHGAAIATEECATTAISTKFTNNVASHAGGSIYFLTSSPLCLSYCNISDSSVELTPSNIELHPNQFGCTFSNNSAAYGNDLATPERSLVSTVLPSSISAVDGVLNLEMHVLDYYSQLVVTIDGVDSSILVVATTLPGVKLLGRSLQSVINGIAIFDGLQMTPDLSVPRDGQNYFNTTLMITTRPSLPITIDAVMKLTDVVLPGDIVKVSYIGPIIVLAAVVCVVGTWTAVIFGRCLLYVASLFSLLFVPQYYLYVQINSHVCPVSYISM